MLQILQFWLKAWRKRPTTKYFSWPRAIPSVLVAIIQFGITYRKSATNAPLTQMWIAIAIIIGVYLVLSIFNAGWNTVIVSPASLDEESQRQIAGLEQTITDLKQDPLEIQRLNLVAEKIAGLSEPARNALKTILMHGDVKLFYVAAVGIKSFDYVQDCVRALLINESGEGVNRVFSVNPDLKASIAAYFKQNGG